MRVGTSAEPMLQEQIDRLFAMRTRNSIGRIVSNRQDLSFEQLRIYYDERGKRLNDNFKRTLESSYSLTNLLWKIPSSDCTFII